MMPSDSSSSAGDSRYNYDVSVSDDTSVEGHNNEDRSHHDEEGSSNVINIMDDMICSANYTMEKNDISIHSSYEDDDNNNIDSDGGESYMPEAEEENNDCNKEEYDTSYVSVSQSQRSRGDVDSESDQQLETDPTIENNDDEEEVGSLGKKLYPIRIPQDNSIDQIIEDDVESDIEHEQSYDDSDDNDGNIAHDQEEEDQSEEIEASNYNDQPIPEVKDSAPDNDEYLTPSILHATNEDDECLIKSLLEQQHSVSIDEDVECAQIDEDGKEIKTTHSPLLMSMNDIEAQKYISNPKTESRIRKARNRRKRVKHRHCKAFIMVFCIWGTTIILISIVLGMDKLWWGASINDKFSIDEHGCTLCGENGLKFGADDVILEPTPSKQPSHWINQLPSLYQLTTALPYEESASTIKQPPDNLFEICSPSIHLHPDMLEDCIRSCTPALCCLKDNETLLISMLESIGISGSQATIYLSTIPDCYNGDDIPVCDTYNDWCATLYDLDYVLEESLPKYFDTCSEEQTQQVVEQEPTATIIAYERSFDPITIYNECEESMCQPVACCYDNMHGLNNRKRHRHHKPNEGNEVSLRRRLSADECQHFNTQRLPLKEEICSAYARFCSQSYVLESTSAYPSLEPSGVPTHIQSLTPSTQVTKLPSTQPSSLTLPTSDNPTDQPESPSIPPSLELSNKMNTTQPSVSKTPSSIPSLQPSSTPSISVSFPSPGINSQATMDPLVSNNPQRPTLDAIYESDTYSNGQT